MQKTVKQKAKKILFTVYLFHPHTGGSEEVVYQLAKRFVKDGHDVTVATQKLPYRKKHNLDGIKIVDFDIRGNGATGYHGDDIDKYKKYLINNNFDITINYAAQSATTDLFLEVIDQIKGKKIMVPCGYPGINNKKYKSYYLFLAKVLKKYDKLIYLSHTYQDKIFHDQCKLKNGVIIPNAADEKEFLKNKTNKFKQKYKIKTKYLAICVANYYMSKGQDFVLDAYRLLPKKIQNNLALVFIGNHIRILDWPWYILLRIKSLLYKNVIYLKQIPRKDTVEAYLSADFFLFGSKIECSPLVMFESFASKTLFISTNCGNVSDFNEISEIVSVPIEMADKIKYYLKNPKAHLKVVDKAFEEYKDKYTWDKIYKQYKNIVKL